MGSLRPKLKSTFNRLFRNSKVHKPEKSKETVEDPSETPEVPKETGELEDQPKLREPTPLLGLPVELLLLITDFLFCTDMFCFALCSAQLWYALERQRRKFAKGNPGYFEERDDLQILQRLEYEFPGYFTCYCCENLHKYDGSESFGLSFPQLRSDDPLPCVRSNHWESLYKAKNFRNLGFGIYTFNKSTIIGRLDFLHVQLATRRFYLGPGCGITCETLSYTQVADPMESELSSVLFSIEAQICLSSISSESPTHSAPSHRLRQSSAMARACPDLPRMCLRIQDVMFLSNRRIYSGGVSDSHDGENLGQMFPPCLYKTCIEARPDFWDLRGAPFHQKSRPIQGRCNTCNTDYEFNIARLGRRTCFLVRTRWFDLGPGLSPEDLQWKVHLKETPYLLLGDQNASPREAFENVSTRSYKALLDCNLSYLKNEKYKTSMERSRSNHNVWVLRS